MASPFVRKSVVAGSFYPGTAADIKRALDELRTRAGDNWNKPRPPILILPHAGWVYSGLAAVKGIQTLVASPPRRIVLIGPSHFHYFLGFSISAYDKYQTPLGEIDGDPELQGELSDLTGFGFTEEAHSREHSLEVILPMLQYLLPKPVKVLTIQAGSAAREDVHRLASALSSSLDPFSDTFIVSTDLSHFYSYDEARELDSETIGFILEGNEDAIEERSGEGGRLCCGHTGVVVAMNLAKRWQLDKPELLIYYNSGDAWGDRGRVVGYASIAYPQPKLTVSGGNAP